jgi:hypothetical protein
VHYLHCTKGSLLGHLIIGCIVILLTTYHSHNLSFPLLRPLAIHGQFTIPSTPISLQTCKCYNQPCTLVNGMDWLHVPLYTQQACPFDHDYTSYITFKLHHLFHPNITLNLLSPQPTMPTT